MPSKKLDQRELFEAAVREGTVAFKKAVATFSNEDFYVFCFYTDNDVTSVYPTAHTVEAYRRLTKGQEDLYYKWSPAEWKIDFGQFGSEDLLGATNKLLLSPNAEYDEEESDEEFFERKKETLETLTKALLAIRATGLFGTRRSPDETACFVNIGDAGDEEAEMMLHPVLDHLPEQAGVELRELFEL